MPRKGKKKVQATKDDPNVEVITRVEIIYEDTKAFTDIEPKYRWGQIYQMIKDQSVLDAGLEDLPIYANIERSAIMKASTRPELFPCAEVIGWILPKADVTKMILSNVDGQGFSDYSLDHVAQSCKLPAPHIYLKEK